MANAALSELRQEIIGIANELGRVGFSVDQVFNEIRRRYPNLIVKNRESLERIAITKIIGELTSRLRSKEFVPGQADLFSKIDQMPPLIAQARGADRDSSIRKNILDMTTEEFLNCVGRKAVKRNSIPKTTEYLIEIGEKIGPYLRPGLTVRDAFGEYEKEHKGK